MLTSWKKRSAVVVAVAIIAGLGAAPAHADADVTVPVLDSFTRTSAATVPAPATITVDFTATEEDTTISSIAFYFRDPLGDLHSATATGTSGTATGQLLVDDPGGLYTLDHVGMFDSAGNSSNYLRDGSVLKAPAGASGPTTHTFDFSAADFTYENDDADTTVPVLDSFTRTSASPLAAPGTITVDFTATEEDTTISSIAFYFRDPLGALHSATATGTSGTATGQLSVDDPGGLYTFDHVGMFDSAGNSSNYLRGGGVLKAPAEASGPTTHTFDFAVADFTYENDDADTTVPVLDSFTRTSASPLAAPGTITVDFTATEEDTTISFVAFYFRDPLGALHSATVSGTSGTATGELLVDDPGGLYTFDHVGMFDSAGNNSNYLRNGTVLNYPSGVSGPTTHSFDFSVADFTYLNGPIATPTYVPLAPTRILDTRTGSGPLGPDEAIEVPVVFPSGPVPAGVRDVVLNVTAANAVDQGYLTVWPSGTTRPPTSNLNVVPSAAVPNLVFAHVGDNGSVSVYSSGTTDVIIDLQGYFPATNPYTDVADSRIVDSRPGGVGLAGPIGPDTSVDISVLGGAVPTSGVSAVVLNVTATGPTLDTYMTVWPAGESRPPTSSLNVIPGQTVANLVIAEVGTDGKVSVYNAFGASDVIIDVQGYFPESSEYVTVVPNRILDTRVTASELGENEVRGITVVGQPGGAPVGAKAVVLNVTITQPNPGGYVTLWAAGSSQPATSNLNFGRGQDVANLVIAEVGVDGKVNIYNAAGTTHVIFDVVGWVPFGAP